MIGATSDEIIINLPLSNHELRTLIEALDGCLGKLNVMPDIDDQRALLSAMEEYLDV